MHVTPSFLSKDKAIRVSERPFAIMERESIQFRVV